MVGRRSLGGPDYWARGRTGGQCDAADSGRQRTARADDRQAPANAPGIRHVLFTVDDIDAAVAGLQARGTELVGEVVRYEDSFRLCYVRGPEGIIVELAERI